MPIIRLHFSPACAIAQEHHLNLQLGPEGRALTGQQVTLIPWGYLQECACNDYLSIIIANTNYQQSIRIIGSPYTFNTAIIVTQSSIFTVHANQEATCADDVPRGK